MMGLEPSTFCMANASSSSRPFAQTPRLQDVPENRANATAPERTPNLAILATEAHPQSERNCVVWAGRSDAARTRSSARRIVGVSGSSSSESGFGGRAPQERIAVRQPV
jgi:hypothetical protein